MWAWLWLACRPSTLAVGDFVVALDRDGGALTVEGPGGARLEELTWLSGDGEASVEMQFGAFRFTEVSRALERSGDFAGVRGRSGPPFVVDVRTPSGDLLGDLVISGAPDSLTLEFTPTAAHDRVGFAAGCDPDDHFLGLGSHAMDVDHVGEAFALWTSEPGIGKSSSDEEPDGWPLEGSRHATSFPVPFLLRPHHPDGLLFDTSGRVEVDLCASDPDRFEVLAWEEGTARVVMVAGGSPLGTVRALTGVTGRPALPPPWVFGPWGDAIRGPERVREVAATLRDAGAPATAIWSEDWKGANETATGYRLDEEWFLDRELYPDAEALAQELEADGFKWLAYFAPFVGVGDETWDSAVAAGALVANADGEPYTFTGVQFTPVGMVDVSTPVGRDWAAGWMRDALDLGFDGWMADYAEWLPTDAVLANGMTGLQGHNRYPEWWQETQLQAIDGRDATFFVRSGWIRTGGLVPVVWAGDQRTSFDADDGFPTVLPLGLGLSASGVPVYTHDVAGYQSVGNDPSDRELWFRWASLGAFSPIFRLHHGSFDTANHQFDSDPETLAHYAAMAREHVRLFPYRYGLAARAAEDGTPMILPVSFLHGEDWGRADVWMLGEALLVAPVLERGATGREVSLPAGVDWWDWWTLAPAGSGFAEAPVDTIPVFAAAGTTVPTFAAIPDTLIDGAAGRVTLADVDGERVVYLFGGGGPFTEADGTTYRPTGRATGPGEVTASGRSGTAKVGGVSISWEGPVERTYTFVVP